MSKQVLVLRWGCPTWIDEEDVMKYETIYGWRGAINDDLIGATAEPMGHQHERYTMTYPPDGTRLPQISERSMKIGRDSWNSLIYKMGYIGTQRSGKSAFAKFVAKEMKLKTTWEEVKPEHIIYNGTTTICIFGDGTKVISRPQKGEKFDKETGVAMCIAKYIYGSRSKFLKAVEKGHQQ